MTKEELKAFPVEVTTRVVCSSFNAQRAIDFPGLPPLAADRYTSFVEFYLSHAFPVITVDGIGIHPQVVANSFRSLLWKVFNLGHIIRSYDPDEHARDRIIGTIIGVDFPALPVGSNGWKVQGSRSAAPGIRAVAVMHKQAEGVDKILGQHQSGRRKWTVSRENDYYLEDSGFLLKSLETPWARSTPEDLAKLGYSYCPCIEAPDELLECYDPKQGKIRRQLNGAPVVLLLGGLNGSVQFKGTGLTPLGKEAEAEVGQMLASDAEPGGHILDEPEEGSMTEFLDPLKKLSDFSKSTLLG